MKFQIIINYNNKCFKNSNLIKKIYTNIKVKMKYKKHTINQSPYLGLGKAVLGFDSGLCGLKISFESDIWMLLKYNITPNH